MRNDAGFGGSMLLIAAVIVMSICAFAALSVQFVVDGVRQIMAG